MKNKKSLLILLLLSFVGLINDKVMSAPLTDTEQEGWTMIGPNNIAGRVRAVVFDKFNDGVIYAGTVGGLYVSVNYGKNWQEISLDGNVQNVTAITQSDDGTLYIGTGEGYYQMSFHYENPTGHSNHPSGKIGSGVFKQNSVTEKEWAKNFSNDADKYNYVKNFTFSVLPATVPADKYDVQSQWAFINTMAYVNGTLYVGTKNGGLKYSTDNGNSFNNISINGITNFEVSDIAVNSDNRIAIAYITTTGSVALNQTGSNTNFTTIFDNNSATLPSRYTKIGRIKLSFGIANPDNLFVMVASNGLSQTGEYDDIYDATGQLLGIYRPADSINGIKNIDTKQASWQNIISSTTSNGNSLGYGMSICVNDREEDELVYMGGLYFMEGKDVNGAGLFSFSSQGTPFSVDTSGAFIPANIHDILLIPNPQTKYDSVYKLIATDAGIYRYCYDSITKLTQWFSSSFGMNNLQAYKISATPDGSVIAATQSNAIVYIPSASDTIKRGEKIWSISNPNYPMYANSTSNPYGGGLITSTFSGSNVAASSIFRTSPAIRKPVLLARPGSNLTRTYSNKGDFETIDDQTWTYGNSDAQTLMKATTADNGLYDPFATPMAVWESFNYTGNNDSIELSLTEYTTIHRDGKTIMCRDGQDIMVGDSVIVTSDNLGYPFFHVFSSSDVNALSEVNDSCYTLGSGSVLFYKQTDMVIKVPQKVQTRLLFATNTGAFVCGKIFDFSKTVNPRPSIGDLTWVKIYHLGVGLSDTATLNKRIHSVAMTQDGSTAFISVDYFPEDLYDRTELIKITGLNTNNLNDGITFQAIEADASHFPAKVVKTFKRQISSIVCDPENSDNMVITFDGYSNAEVNVMKTTNAMTDGDITFTAMDLNPDNLSTNKRPVFTAMYEKVGGTDRIYAGSDDGIYYTTGTTWTKDVNVPKVAVYDLRQPVKQLPQWNFL